MPDDGDPRHPVWNVYRPILEYQLAELGNLSNQQVNVAPRDLDTVVTYVMRGLARGWDQKTLCKRLTPSVYDAQHRDILDALASWVFATQGVLSHIYQPVLSQHAVDNVATWLGSPTWGPPMSQHSILLRLPNEVFDKILKYLPVQDVNNVRLTCRQSRDKSFDFWSKTFFTTRQFMIDQYSLQTLLDISRHPELCSVLTHLIIGLDEINTEDTLSFIHRMHATNPARIAAMFRYWRDAAAAQHALLRTGRAIELLSQAMSNLTELKAVSVSGSINSPYDHSFPDTIYYPHLGLRSYGAWAYQMQRRDQSDIEANSKGFLDVVFSCVFNSMVRSLPKKLLALRTNLGRGQFLPYLNDEAFNLPPFAPFSTENLNFLANLTELHLDVNLESRSTRRINRGADHRHTFDPENTSLRQLLCACHSLVSLTLNVICLPSCTHHCDFTGWLVDTADNPSGTPAYWPFLRKLVLKGLKMSPATLRNIFVKFDTLNSAALQRITLEECFLDRPPVPYNSQEQLENLWAAFFRGCAVVLSNLESLELHQLGVQRYREDPDQVLGRRSDKDYDLIRFDLEATKPGEKPPDTFTVTDFRQEALETLAEQTLFFNDWKRAKEVAEAAAAGIDVDGG